MSLTTPTTKADGNATLSTFEGNQLVSSETVYCCGYEGGRSAYWPHLATICPECGEVWRREVYTYHFLYQPLVPDRWRSRSELCPACVPKIFQQLLKEHSW